MSRPSRSRSSTLSLRSDANEHPFGQPGLTPGQAAASLATTAPSNQRVPSPRPIVIKKGAGGQASTSEWNRGMDTAAFGSYKSAHSMRTVRRPDSDLSESDDDFRSVKTAQEGPHPQITIDISPATPSVATHADGNRSRSSSTASTFGGVRLPAAPPIFSGSKPLQEEDEHELGTAPQSTTLHVLQSRSRSSSTSSIPSSLYLGGGADRPLSERRPVLYAAIKATMLFAFALGTLTLVLKTMLPPLTPEDKEHLRIPKDLDALKELNELLQKYKEHNYWRVLICFSTVYLFLQAFSIPGSMYLSILAGAMYGVAIALPLVCFCVATGALLCYLISAALGPAVLSNSEKWTLRLEAWKQRIRSHNDNLISYLIILRIAPLPPHFVLNILAPHVGISIFHFWVSTFLGIMGVSFIHTQLGTALDEMTSADDFHLISFRNFAGLAGIVVAVLVPVAIKYRYKSDIEDAGRDVDNLTGARGTEEESGPLLPSSHSRDDLSEAAPKGIFGRVSQFFARRKEACRDAVGGNGVIHLDDGDEDARSFVTPASLRSSAPSSSEDDSSDLDDAQAADDDVQKARQAKQANRKERKSLNKASKVLGVRQSAISSAGAPAARRP